jgi:hypothetical protein
MTTAALIFMGYENAAYCYLVLLKDDNISEDIHNILTLWSEAKVASPFVKVPPQLQHKANQLWHNLFERKDYGEVRNLQTIDGNCRFYQLNLYD